MSIYLIEAHRIINMLYRQVPIAEKFMYDKEFLACLSEEIRCSSHEPKTLYASFILDESGDVAFNALSDERSKDATVISIQVENVEAKAKLDEEQEKKKEQARIAEDCLDMELKLKKRDLMDKLLKVNA